MSRGNGWTEAHKQRQREAIQRWKPWEQSTGPRTARGKAAAAANSRKHGLFDARSRDLMRCLHELLREQREALKRL